MRSRIRNGWHTFEREIKKYSVIFMRCDVFGRRCWPVRGYCQLASRFRARHVCVPSWKSSAEPAREPARLWDVAARLCSDVPSLRTSAHMHMNRRSRTRRDIVARRRCLGNIAARKRPVRARERQPERKFSHRQRETEEEREYERK